MDGKIINARQAFGGMLVWAEAAPTVWSDRPPTATDAEAAITRTTYRIRRPPPGFVAGDDLEYAIHPSVEHQVLSHWFARRGARAYEIDYSHKAL